MNVERGGALERRVVAEDLVVRRLAVDVAPVVLAGNADAEVVEVFVRI